MTTRGLCAAVVALAFATVGVSAQSLRVTGSTALRYIELRPFVRDSVEAEATAGTGLLRQLADGRIVRCIPGEVFCHDTRAGARASTVPVITDLEASAWGFGEGIRLYGHIRGRTAWGSNTELWPRSDDALDVLAAYAELERTHIRVRAGRQWKVSGLGFYNFDGLALTARPLPSLSVDAYAGRSLLRGLNEQRTSGALEAIEALAPPAPGLLTGVQLRYRPSARFSLGTTYQIDFRDDGAGLYSELAAADGVLRVGAAFVEGALELDVASRVLNEARVRVRAPPVSHVALAAELRRYRPYFELWTIWGAFSPVGFTEAQASATWAEPRGRVLVRGEGSYRVYGETDSEAGFEQLRSEGWSLGAVASWLPDRHWRVDGAYRVETGFGAARRDGHVGVQRQLGDVGSLALQALAFQRLYELRLNEGTVLGLGAEAWFRLSERARVTASAAAYRHVEAGTMPGLDWNQRRASVRMQWTLGSEPGSVGGIR